MINLVPDTKRVLTGSYTGDGTNSRHVEIGIECAFVVIYPTTQVHSVCFLV
jgi:hypothetical protein